MRRPIVAVLALAAAGLAACETTQPVDPVVIPADPAVVFEPIGRYDTGLGESAAEIATYEDGRAYVTNAAENALDIVDLADPTEPALIERVSMDRYGAGINSVDAKGDVVVVAVEADPKTDPGTVVFLDRDGALLSSVRVGALPDMVTFTPDGRYVLVANEGEPNDDYDVDPEGTITVITAQPFIEAGTGGATTSANEFVRTVDFRAYDPGGTKTLPSGVRIYGPGATPSQDLEPEYIGVSGDSRNAYVTLQENNAVAVVDVATATLVRIDALGTKDHMVAGNGLDPSDRDDAIAIANWPVNGVFEPDSIAVADLAGGRYYLTANEGDTRDYDGFGEEERIKDLELDPTNFPDAEALQSDEQIGRLTATVVNGDVDDDGDYDFLEVPGGRSFTIRSAKDGRRVWDSGDHLEQLTAQLDPDNFNSNQEPDSFDSRSDNKGPEPEALAVGRIGSSTYAFVGLERTGGIVIYDITDPTAPTFVQFANPSEDAGPEHIEFVSAGRSPSGRPLLLVSNEISGTVAVYQASEAGSAES